jgi:hypothetical protein
MLVAENQVVVVVRYQAQVHWYRSDRDLWVLDSDKWRQEFINHGYDVPDFNEHFRFGLRIVNQKSAERFLAAMRQYELQQDELSLALVTRYASAKSWWDVRDLFPIMFVNFDACEVAAFYPDGTPMERYVPDGWTGRFIDFANDYPEGVFPAESKFWIKDGVDLLALLNERGATRA